MVTLIFKFCNSFFKSFFVSYGYSCERYYINTKRWHMKTFIKVICKIRFNWTHFEMSWNSIKEVQILHFFNKTLSRPNIPVHGLPILSHLASLSLWNSLSGSTEHRSFIHLQMFTNVNNNNHINHCCTITSNMIHWTYLLNNKSIYFLLTLQEIAALIVSGNWKFIVSLLKKTDWFVIYIHPYQFTIIMIKIGGFS